MATIEFVYTQDLAITRKLLAYWIPEYESRSGEIKRIHRLVKQTAATLGIWDEDTDFPVTAKTETYQYELLKHAFDAAARNHLPGARTEVPPFYQESENAQREMRMVSFHLRRNINRVNKEEAIALPGLGKKSANRLLAFRSLNGSFDDWEEVRKAAGIGKNALERLKQKTYLGPVEADQVRAGAFEKIQNGGVRTLVELLLLGEVIWEKLNNLEDTYKILLETIRRLSAHIMHTPHRPRFWKPSIARLGRRSRYFEKHTSMREQMSSDIDGVGYVSGSQYLDIVLCLLENASINISLNMFFFHVEEGGPGMMIVEQLEAAKARGVVVKIILDNDLAGDYHNARNVNASIFALLESKGIDYHTSYPDRTSHTKLLVVDNSYVLCGSHNWTTSSVYRYEDTSFIVCSNTLAEKAVKQFDRLYEMLSEESSRTIYLEELEYLSDQEKITLITLGIDTHTKINVHIAAEDSRVSFTGQSGIDKEKLKNLYYTLQWMQTVKISETTALALSVNELHSLDKVQDATEKEVVEALGQLSVLPEPFKYRAIPRAIAGYLKSL